MFGKLRCAITQRHDWESSTDDIDLSTTAFKRIDCLRCGTSVEGVAAKQLKARLMESSNPRMRAAADALP